jgi:hypothetical protein
VLSAERVSDSADKVKDVRDSPAPRNFKDIWAFLGLASFTGLYC